MAVPVRGQNGKLYEVDLENGLCDCSGYAAKGRCNHSAIVSDIFNNSGKRFKWEIVSAFKKEVRRSDLEKAVMWGRCFARISGMKEAAIMSKELAYRESRNLNLFREIKEGKLTDKEIIYKAIRSKKRWECDYLTNYLEDWIEGFRRYYTHREDWNTYRNIGTVLRAFLSKCETPSEAYEVWFFVNGNRQMLRPVLSMLYDRAIDDKNEKLKDFLDLKNTSIVACMIGLELLVGCWSEEANEYHEDIEITEDYIPRFEDYIYDCDSPTGIKRLIKSWKKIEPQKPMAAENKIDLRWSDQHFGLGWRFLGHRQYGSLREAGDDIPWERVDFPMGMWSALTYMDSYFFQEKVYKPLLKAGYEVPLWKEEYGS